MAPIPFQTILEQPFFIKERLMWGSFPQLLVGWRGRRRMEKPLSPSDADPDETKAIDQEKIWATRLRGPRRVPSTTRQAGNRSGSSTSAPFPKAHKNFRTAGARAHARRLVQLATEDKQAQLHAILFKQTYDNTAPAEDYSTHQERESREAVPTTSTSREELPPELLSSNRSTSTSRTLRTSPLKTHTYPLTLNSIQWLTNGGPPFHQRSSRC